MTSDRLKMLGEYWTQNPPVHLMVHAIGRWLGIKSRDEASSGVIADPDAMEAMVGGGGMITAGP